MNTINNQQKDFEINPLLMTFMNKEEEIKYRVNELPVLLNSLKKSIILASIFNLLYLISDYLATNGEGLFLHFVIIRILISFMMLVVIWFAHFTKSPATVDYMILSGLIIFTISVIWITFHRSPSNLTAAGPLVTIVAIYIFIPQRFIFTVLHGILSSALFYGVYYFHIQNAYSTYTILIAYILVNVFCIFDSRQMHIKKRRIYYTLETEKLIQERLLKSNQIREQLVRVISHDLRGHIGNIMTIFTILSEKFFEYEKFSTEQKKSFNHLLTSGEIQSESTFALLENLLEWAKRLQGKTQLKSIPVSVKEVLDPAIAIFQLQRENKGIAIDCKYFSDQHRVFVDPESCKTLFRNVLGNAIKFSNPGSKVLVTVSSVDQQVVIKIQDSGIGMPSEKLQDLKINHTTKSTFGTNNELGTGLGYQLIFQCIEANCGSLDIESKEGIGTTVTISLPAASG